MDPTPLTHTLLVSALMISLAKKEYNARKGFNYSSPSVKNQNFD
jgi:hypothetical protein